MPNRVETLAEIQGNNCYYQLRTYVRTDVCQHGADGVQEWYERCCGRAGGSKSCTGSAQSNILESYHITGIAESWTHGGVLDAELYYDGYTHFRCDSSMWSSGWWSSTLRTQWISPAWLPYLQIPGTGLVSLTASTSLLICYSTTPECTGHW